MTRTGSKISGPASDLVELENDKGLRHLGITFHRRYRGHGALQDALGRSRAFLEQPDVCDLLELVEVVPDSGAFIYPTGKVISVARMLEVLAKMGEPAGVKAGLELCYLVAQILDEAAEKGDRQGAPTHGDISPWRIVCRADGQVQVIGYGLPQLDMALFRDDGTMPKEDGFRYCPPERIEGEPEDFSSDLFSLCLVAFEVMVGEPLYNGVASEIKQQASNAQGPYRLYPYRERLPEGVIDVLSRALKYDMDARYADVNEFIWDVKDLLGMPEVEGPSLAEVVGKVRQKLRRGSALQGGATAAMTPEELAEIADELDGPRRRDLRQPRRGRPGEDEPEDADDQQRWGRVSRSGARAGRQQTPTAADRLKERLGRSGGRGGDRKAALKDRLRRSSGRDGPGTRKRSRDDGPRKSGRRDGPRRSRAREPEPEPPPEDTGRASRTASRGAGKKKGRASSLLKRLRSSQGSAPSEAEAPSAVSGRAVTVRIDDGPTRTVTLPEETPVAVLVRRALEAVGGPPVSLTGALEGWFAAEQDGRPLVGSAPVSELADEPVDLVFRDAAPVVARVEVATEPPIRFRAPVHTALTAGAVLDQVVRLLELDPEGWQIAVGGRSLHPLQVVGEVVDEPDVTVVVRK